MAYNIHKATLDSLRRLCVHCRLGVVCTLDEVYDAPVQVKAAMRESCGLHRQVLMENSNPQVGLLSYGLVETGSAAGPCTVFILSLLKHAMDLLQHAPGRGMGYD